VISLARNGVLALLLLAAAAPANAVPPGSPPPTAPPPTAPPTTGAPAPAKAAIKAATVAGKPGKPDADDDNDPDFPPMKPGDKYHLLGFSISGSKHIDADALIATLPEHEGDPITQAQVKADTDRIKKALAALHVHFSEVTAGFVQREGPDHGVYVVWDIQHVDPFSRLQYQGYWKFGGQTFSGNKALSRDQLDKAIGLKPGDRVREGAVSDARTGMEQAYEKVFPGQTVKIGGKLKLAPGRVATIEWQITEPAAK
jgi:hypothetical protein